MLLCIQAKLQQHFILFNSPLTREHRWTRSLSTLVHSLRGLVEYVVYRIFHAQTELDFATLLQRSQKLHSNTHLEYAFEDKRVHYGRRHRSRTSKEKRGGTLGAQWKGVTMYLGPPASACHTPTLLEPSRTRDRCKFER